MYQVTSTKGMHQTLPCGRGQSQTNHLGQHHGAMDDLDGTLSVPLWQGRSVKSVSLTLSVVVEEFVYSIQENWLTVCQLAFCKLLVMVIIAFSSRVKILGEGLTNHSLPVHFFKVEISPCTH